jgi:hypothetical protein
MNLLISILPHFTWVIIGAVILVSAHYWGAYAARQARLAGSAQWKAYVLAIIPAFGMCLSLAVGGKMDRFIPVVFVACALPSFLATHFYFHNHEY